MTPHPDYPTFFHRLNRIGLSGRAFSGTVYRFISPRFAKPEDVVSGAGGLSASGRWNLKGAYPISYTSLDPETALSETLAHARFFRLPIASSLPKTLVSIDTRLSNVLDLTDGNLRRRLILSSQTIQTHNWRLANQHLEEALTQAWGRCFFEAGHEAVLVPSATSRGKNLIVYPSNVDAKSTFEVTP